MSLFKSKFATELIDLSSANGFSWSLSCIDDPEHADILPVGATCPATVPGTLFDDLKSHLPDPFLIDNNVLPIFSKVEKASFSFELSFDLSSTSLPSKISSYQTLLILEGLDTYATVSLNGEHILSSENAFQKYTIPLRRDALSTTGNVLCVDFSSIHIAINKRPGHTYKEWNDPVGGISRVRTPQYVAGWDWGPRLLGCGISGSVQLACIPIARIVDFACQQSFPQHDLKGTPTYVRISVFANVMVHNEANIPSAESKLVFNGTEEEVNDKSVALKCVPMEIDTRSEQLPGSKLWHEELACQHFKLVRFKAVLNVSDPKLWWPNGMGQQNLYIASMSLTQTDGGHIYYIDSWSTSIGLRELQLVREPTPGLSMHDAPLALKTVEASVGNDSRLDSLSKGVDSILEDELSESFVFAVNGRRFFSKGANYIHPKVLHATTTSRDYEDVLLSARGAHMNMLRVWGGGLYEKDTFYEICNKLGILLWHDFMFSCSLYPGDDEFMESCKREAKYQVARLRNHPCMALWCGNNELEQVPHDITKTSETEAAYERLFYDILKNVVEDDVGQIPYWPCSPHNPAGYKNGFNNPRAGDTHFWDVWHARRPVTAYLNHVSRFCSEFGMQSYLSEAGARQFAGNGTGALNPYGPILEAHQKNSGGNMIIMEYCQRLFRMPKSNYGDISYQSQLNQAFCMRVGVEHFRRSWPYCAGATYWQLNDCWPCFSWSSIEYGGNWKALHYTAKKFFNPLLLTLVHHGTESIGICNLTTLSEQTGKFSVHAVYDGEDPEVDVLCNWSVIDMSTGNVRMEGKLEHNLKRDSSVPLALIDAQTAGNDPIDPHSHVVQATMVSKCGKWKSSATGWFCSPRLCDLPESHLKLDVVQHESGDGLTTGVVEMQSDTFAPWCELWYAGNEEVESHCGETEGVEALRYSPPTKTKFSDNFFDLFPRVSQTVRFEISKELSLEQLQSFLQCRSLSDSYSI